MRRLYFILVFIWSVQSMIYYGILLGSLPGGVLVNNAVLGLMSVLGGIGMVLVFKKYRFRRPILITQYISTGLLLIIMAVLIRFEGRAVRIATQTCALTAYALACASFTCIILYTSESLPTQFRASGYGILSASCRFGSIIGMQLLKLGKCWTR